MGIFSRLGTLIKSNINEMISRAEDPEKMLNQVLIEMQKQLVDAKKQVAVSIGDEKRIRKQCDDELEKTQDWERKAMVAVRAGDDNLAREGLARKAEHSEAGSMLLKQWEGQKTAVEKLKDSLRALNSKIEEAKRKKGILIARKKRAEAQKSIQNTMAGLSDTSAFETFDRMAEKINQLEAEAEAGVEIAGELSGDQLKRKFDQLEASAGTEQALLELKQKMGLLEESTEKTPIAALPEAKEELQIDGELAALKAKVLAGTKKEA